MPGCKSFGEYLSSGACECCGGTGKREVTDGLVHLAPDLDGEGEIAGHAEARTTLLAVSRVLR